MAVRGARIWARNRYGLAEREEGVKSSKGRAEQSRKWEKNKVPQRGMRRRVLCSAVPNPNSVS